MRTLLLVSGLLLLAVASCLAAGDEPARSAEHPVVLTVQIKSQAPVGFTAEDLSKLDRAKLQAAEEEPSGARKDGDQPVGDRPADDPSSRQQTYEGVPLASILHAAGVTWGTKCSLWLDCYVTADAADEYRAVFSIPEIDPGLAHKLVLLADRRDGKPLTKAAGPYQLVEEDAKQRGRWVKQVTTIRVRMAAE